MIFPKNFDAATRMEFYRWLGQTFRMYLAVGFPPDAARAEAVQYTQEKIDGFPRWLEQKKVT